MKRSARRRHARAGRGSLLGALLFLATAVPADEALMAPLAQPFAAPDFDLPCEGGGRCRLADYRGKVVLLNFWATWCPPCRAEMPSLERAWQKLGGKEVVVLAVNVGEDEDAIFAFQGDYPVSFPIPMDESGSVVKDFRVTGLPTTYLVTPDGRVTHRAMGTREWDSAAMLAWLRAQARPRQGGTGDGGAGRDRPDRAVLNGR